MSYCRFARGESDVYLCPTLFGHWMCYNCHLAPELIEGFHKSGALFSLEEVKAHLEAHQEAGHLVPDYAFGRIEWEMKAEVFRRKCRRMMRSSRGKKYEEMASS